MISTQVKESITMNDMQIDNYAYAAIQLRKPPSDRERWCGENYNVETEKVYKYLSTGFIFEDIQMCIGGYLTQHPCSEGYMLRHKPLMYFGTKEECDKFCEEFNKMDEIAKKAYT